MKFQVIISRTDTGANIHVKSNSRGASKEATSWSDALAEAEHLGLINGAESIAAKALPPGFPLHTSTDTDLKNLIGHGFVPDKVSSPQ